MKYLSLFLFIALLFVGCGPKPKPVVIEPVVVEPVVVEPVVVLEKFAFTKSMIREHNLTSEQISNLQFYISNDIELQKTVPEQIANVSNGTLVVNKQDKIKTVLIKADTPCIATQADEHKIVVKFKENFELTFMNSGNRKDLFLLSALKWNNGVGELLVDGEIYQAIGKSGQAYLKIAKTNVDNTDKNSLTIDGELLK